MKKRYILAIHFGVFMVLATGCLLTSEMLLNALMPGYSNVESWILLVLFEMVAIFVATLISCIIFIRTRKKYPID